VKPISPPQPLAPASFIFARAFFILAAAGGAFALILLAAPIAFAQSAAGQAQESGAADGFDAFPQDWLVEGFTDFSFYSFYLGAPAVQGVAYLPNFSPKLGVATTYKGASLSLSLPLPAQEVERRGNSDQASVIFNPSFRGFSMDIYYQYYRGFYEDSPLTEIAPNRPDRYPQLPDTVVNNYGLNAYFALAPSAFSILSAFRQLERQRQSGGSILLSPFFNRLSISNDGRFIPGSSPNSPATGPNLAQGVFDTAGGGLGYGYAFVRGPWFIAMQGIAGLGAQYQQIDRADGSIDDQLALALKLNGRLAAGYNGDERAAGVAFLGDSLSARIGDEQFSSSLVSAQAFYGERF
jgi:hypothetical protein